LIRSSIGGARRERDNQRRTRRKSASQKIIEYLAGVRWPVLRRVHRVGSRASSRVHDDPGLREIRAHTISRRSTCSASASPRSRRRLPSMNASGWPSKMASTFATVMRRTIRSCRLDDVIPLHRFHDEELLTASNSISFAHIDFETISALHRAKIAGGAIGEHQRSCRRGVAISVRGSRLGAGGGGGGTSPAVLPCGAPERIARIYFCSGGALLRHCGGRCWYPSAAGPNLIVKEGR